MPKTSKIIRIIHIGLHQPEADIISRIEDRGWSVTDIARQMIREFGDKTFPEAPDYAKAAKKRAELAEAKLKEDAEFKNMTNEDYATKILRGKVKGEKVGFRVAGGQQIEFNLSTIKQYTLENNEVVAIHNQLLDKTFVYPNNKPPTEQQYKEIWKGW